MLSQNERNKWKIIFKNQNQKVAITTPKNQDRKKATQKLKRWMNNQNDKPTDNITKINDISLILVILSVMQV